MNTWKMIPLLFVALAALSGQTPQAKATVAPAKSAQTAKPTEPAKAAEPIKPASKPVDPSGMTGLTDHEKLEMWTMIGEYQKSAAAMQTVQQEANAKAALYESRVKELRTEHHAGTTCTLDQLMSWDCSAAAGAPKK